MSDPRTPELPFAATPAIDEMNLVEIPFALMVRSSKQRVLDLSPDGEDRLVADESVGGLPTALGERVLVALLYYHKRVDGFRSPRVRLPLRVFLCDYLYPERDYRPSATAYEAVQDQLRRIAHTRIVSSRWYDKSLGRQVAIDASIIDYIKVVEDGGNNRPKMLELRWGELFFNSLKARYTKPLDYRLWLQLERPLTRRLYRWLDRQLYSKASETVRAWQFGRFKLGLTHQRMSAPGRRGSNYLVKQLRSSIEEIRTAGFPVSLAVDSTDDDFQLTFSRMETSPTPASESVVVDPVTDLLDYFNLRAHGLSAGRSHAPKDRELAASWLTSYGADAARVLVSASLELCRRRKDETPFKFRRLAFYEDAAAGHLDRVANESQGQLPLAPIPKVEPEPLPSLDVPEDYQALNTRFFLALTPSIRAVIRPLAYVSTSESTLRFHTQDPVTVGFLAQTHRSALLRAARESADDVDTFEIIKD